MSGGANETPHEASARMRGERHYLAIHDCATIYMQCLTCDV